MFPELWKLDADFYEPHNLSNGECERYLRSFDAITLRDGCDLLTSYSKIFDSRMVYSVVQVKFLEFEYLFIRHVVVISCIVLAVILPDGAVILHCLNCVVHSIPGECWQTLCGFSILNGWRCGFYSICARPNSVMVIFVWASSICHRKRTWLGCFPGNTKMFWTWKCLESSLLVTNSVKSLHWSVGLFSMSAHWASDLVFWFLELEKNVFHMCTKLSYLLY